MGNISRKSYTTVKYFTKMLSAVSDTVIFIFLGIVLVNKRHVWNTGFVVWSAALCLVYRFLTVFGLTYFVNMLGRVKKINLEEQFIMAYGGLRGAVAFLPGDHAERVQVPQLRDVRHHHPGHRPLHRLHTGWPIIRVKVKGPLVELNYLLA
ncbi:hypothetical protein MTO96_009467 [Rhipicephalus appendiculatus]